MTQEIDTRIGQQTVLPDPDPIGRTGNQEPGGERQGGGGRRRSMYATKDFTQGSIPKNLFTLAWPQMVAGSLQTVDQLADLVWAGFIGTGAIASIGVVQSWTQLLNTARQGLDTATRAQVSRAVGAGNVRLANHVAQHSFLLSGGVTIVLASLAAIFTPFLLYLLGVSDEVIASATLYMRVQFIAIIAQALQFTSSTVLQASGDTLTPMKAQLANRLIHVALSPLLVFGLGPFPALGLMGASAATLVAQTVGAGMNIRVLIIGSSRLHLTAKDFHLDLPLLWRMIRIGAPSSVTSMERSLAQVMLVALVTPFGNMTLAAYSITQRVQMFVNLGSQGVGQASGILAGQNLGAQRPDRAKATVWWALGYVVIMNSLIAGCIFLFPTLLLSIFTRDRALLEIAVPWLHIQVLGFMFIGTGMVFQQTFNTAGDTFVPMVVILGSMWGIQQPLAIMLSGVAENWTIFGWDVPVPTIGNLGQFGIAWALTISVGARLALYLPYFLWGPWMKKKVL